MRLRADGRARVLTAFAVLLLMNLPAIALDPRDRAIVFPIETSNARIVRWTPDGTRLFLANAVGPVELREARTGAMIKTLGPPDQEIDGIWTSPDGQRLLVRAIDGTSTLFDMASRAAQATFERTSSAGPEFSKDGRFLALSEGDRTLLVVDALAGFSVTARLEHAGALGNVAMAPDGTRIVTTSQGGRRDVLTLWTLGNSPARREVPIGDDVLRQVTFSSDGNEIVLTTLTSRESPGETVRILDAAGGEPPKTLSVSSMVTLPPEFSRDGARALIPSAAGGLTVWRTADWSLEKTLVANDDTLFATGFGPGDRTVVLASNNGLQVFAAPNWTEILHRAPNVAVHRMKRVSLSPDRMRIAVEIDDAPLEIWPLEPVYALAKDVSAGNTEALFARADALDQAGKPHEAEEIWGLVREAFRGTPAAERAAAKLDEKSAALSAEFAKSAEVQAREDETLLAAFGAGGVRKDAWMAGCRAGTNMQLDVPSGELEAACACMFSEMQKRLDPDHFRMLFLAMSAAGDKPIAAATRLLIRKEKGLQTYITTLQRVTEEVKSACKFSWGTH